MTPRRIIAMALALAIAIVAVAAARVALRRPRPANPAGAHFATPAGKSSQ